MRLPLLATCAVLSAVLPAAASAFGPDAGPDPAVSASEAGARIERQGEELFGRNCQLCHNSRGKGGKGPQLVKGAWGPGGANSDAQMFAIIKHGRPGTQMGGFGNQLSDEEIGVIVAFLRAESRRVQAAERKAARDDHVPW